MKFSDAKAYFDIDDVLSAIYPTDLLVEITLLMNRLYRDYDDTISSLFRSRIMKTAMHLHYTIEI